MAISVHFRHAGLTPEKYDEAIRQLEATGHGAPAGRLDHIAFDVNGEIEVFDIWESAEALEKWGPEGFVPVLLDLGVELHPPTIHPATRFTTSSTPNGTHRACGSTGTPVRWSRRTGPDRSDRRFAADPAAEAEAAHPSDGPAMSGFPARARRQKQKDRERRDSVPLRTDPGSRSTGKAAPAHRAEADHPHLTPAR